MGLDFSIQYRKGIENVVVNASSRREEGIHYEISMVGTTQLKWMENFLESYKEDEYAKEHLTIALIAIDSQNKVTITNGVLRYKGKLYVKP